MYHSVDDIYHILYCHRVAQRQKMLHKLYPLYTWISNIDVRVYEAKPIRVTLHYSLINIVYTILMVSII